MPIPEGLTDEGRWAKGLLRPTVDDLLIAHPHPRQSRAHARTRVAESTSGEFQETTEQSCR
jgi:hypothetical protein